jgi:hypothetical protein
LRFVFCAFAIRQAGIVPIARVLKKSQRHHQSHAARSAK